MKFRFPPLPVVSGLPQELSDRVAEADRQTGLLVATESSIDKAARQFVEGPAEGLRALKWTDVENAAATTEDRRWDWLRGTADHAATTAELCGELMPELRRLESQAADAIEGEKGKATEQLALAGNGLESMPQWPGNKDAAQRAFDLRLRRECTPVRMAIEARDEVAAALQHVQRILRELREIERDAIVELRRMAAQRVHPQSLKTLTKFATDPDVKMRRAATALPVGA